MNKNWAIDFPDLKTIRYNCSKCHQVKSFNISNITCETKFTCECFFPVDIETQQTVWMEMVYCKLKDLLKTLKVTNQKLSTKNLFINMN